MPLTPFPPAPSRIDPLAFADKADAWLDHFESPFIAEFNAAQADINAKELSAREASDDAVDASSIATSASEAAQFTAGALMWDAATDYDLGQNAISPTDFKTYRRKVAGTSATDPSADATNWVLVFDAYTKEESNNALALKANENAVVKLTGAQTVAGAKTFSDPITLGASQLATPPGSAPSYTCRAWVNFNGTGTVAIRASGNVSSIVDNGVGDFTINFTTAMPDANYAPAFGGISNISESGSSGLAGRVGVRASGGVPTLKSTTQLRVYTRQDGGILGADPWEANVQIFR